VVEASFKTDTIFKSDNVLIEGWISGTPGVDNWYVFIIAAVLVRCQMLDVCKGKVCFPPAQKPKIVMELVLVRYI